jgi:hypothetical protein
MRPSMPCARAIDPAVARVSPGMRRALHKWIARDARGS